MTSPSVPGGRRIVVDPRFRARRIAVRKQAGRRRLRRLLVLVALAASALAAVVVLESPILDVDEVAVTGTENLQVSTIAEAAGIDLGAPLLLADLDAASRAVESLPWVEDATVSRDLPSRVVVDVTERVPGAVVSAAGTAALVDANGQVLATGDPADYPSHVPRDPPFVHVVAPRDLADEVPAPGGAVHRDLRTGVALAERLRADPPGAVAAIRLEPTLSLDLVGGGRVDLGDETDLDLKVEAFRTMFARVDLACLKTLDLRVPTRPVLTRGATCS